MNIHKLRMVLDYIRSKGGIPVDGTGRKLTKDETLIWYGVDRILTPDEQAWVKEELEVMAELDHFRDILRCGSD
jgi:hypothetical protein